jgi:hypothetical protein
VLPSSVRVANPSKPGASSISSRVRSVIGSVMAARDSKSMSASAGRDEVEDAAPLADQQVPVDRIGRDLGASSAADHPADAATGHGHVEGGGQVGVRRGRGGQLNGVGDDDRVEEAGHRVVAPGRDGDEGQDGERRQGAEKAPRDLVC